MLRTPNDRHARALQLFVISRMAFLAGVPKMQAPRGLLKQQRVREAGFFRYLAGDGSATAAGAGLSAKIVVARDAVRPQGGSPSWIRTNGRSINSRELYR